MRARELLHELIDFVELRRNLQILDGNRVVADALDEILAEIRRSAAEADREQRGK